MSTLSATLTLFLMMDPIGNVPAFATFLKNVDTRRRSAVVLRESFIALGVLLFFLLFGPSVMSRLGIEEAALSVAGGVVLFIVALEMIFPGRRSSYVDPTATTAEPFIVPMAIPMIAGPSTMAVLMLMASREPDRWGDWALALLVAWTAGLIVLLLANRLRPLLGQRALAALERLMGMVLLVMAVQMSMSGLAGFFRSVNPATAPAAMPGSISVMSQISAISVVG